MNVELLEQIGRTGDALAITRSDLADAMFWIREYGKYLATASMTGEYRSHIKRSLAQRKRDYTRLMQEAHALELKFAALNGEYHVA